MSELTTFGLLGNAGGVMAGRAASAADAEQEWVSAIAAVGEDVAIACRDWAYTTTMRNNVAFGMCWRAGGPDSLQQEHRLCLASILAGEFVSSE